MKRLFGVIFLCAVVTASSGCGVRPLTPWQYTDTAMGTIIQQNIYAVEEEAAQELSGEVMRLLKSLEEERISWRKETSEVARLNATAGTGETFALSAELTGILEQCLEVSKASDGAFDVTIGSVTCLWNIDSWASKMQEGTFAVPEQSVLNQALADAGYEKLLLQQAVKDGLVADTTQPIGATTVLPAGMQLDFGAVGKGLALEQIQELLKAQTEIPAAVISAGGSILTYGTKPDGSPWKVGVVNPDNTSQNIAVLALEGDWYVATSGDYERYVEVDGVRYHHMIDPATGYPVDNNVRSVTIISREGLLSDALSTACFVLGVEKGLELAEGYEAEVLFVLEDGEMVMSEGMKEDYPGIIVIN